jgi:hypothetical protein
MRQRCSIASIQCTHSDTAGKDKTGGFTDVEQGSHQGNEKGRWRAALVENLTESD